MVVEAKRFACRADSLKEEVNRDTPGQGYCLFENFEGWRQPATLLQRQWAYAYLAMSRDQLQADDVDSAIDSATQGIRIEEKLVADSPTNATAQNTLALLYLELGD